MAKPTEIRKRDDNQCPWCLARLPLEKIWNSVQIWERDLNKLEKDKGLLAHNADNIDQLADYTETMDNEISKHKAKYPYHICPNCKKKLQLGYRDFERSGIVLPNAVKRYYICIAPLKSDIVNIVSNN